MLAALCLAFVQGLEPYPPSRFDRVIPIVLDADDSRIDGRGRAERIECVAEFSGTLHVWTSATDSSTDAWLRIEDRDGTLVGEDDDSGGGKTPYLKLDVLPGRALTISTSVIGDALRYELQLHAIAAPETPGTIAAAKKALESIAEIKRLRENRGLGAARELATKTLERLSSTVGAAGG